PTNRVPPPFLHANARASNRAATASGSDPAMRRVLRAKCRTLRATTDRPPALPPTEPLADPECRDAVDPSSRAPPSDGRRHTTSPKSIAVGECSGGSGAMRKTTPETHRRCRLDRSTLCDTRPAPPAHADESALRWHRDRADPNNAGANRDRRRAPIADV